MDHSADPVRRRLLGHVAAALSLIPLAARAADPALSEADPAAKAVEYIEDGSHAKDAQKGAVCANCGLYNGASGAARGACSLFPGKTVTAAGWCNKWSGF